MTRKFKACLECSDFEACGLELGSFEVQDLMVELKLDSISQLLGYHNDSNVYSHMSPITFSRPILWLSSSLSSFVASIRCLGQGFQEVCGPAIWDFGPKV